MCLSPSYLMEKQHWHKHGSDSRPSRCRRNPWPRPISSLGWSLGLLAPRTSAGCCRTAHSWRTCKGQRSLPTICGWGRGRDRGPCSQRSCGGSWRLAWRRNRWQRRQTALSPSRCSPSRTWAAGSSPWSGSFCSMYPASRRWQQWWRYTSPGSVTTNKHSNHINISWYIYIQAPVFSLCCPPCFHPYMLDEV